MQQYIYFTTDCVEGHQKLHFKLTFYFLSTDRQMKAHDVWIVVKFKKIQIHRQYSPNRQYGYLKIRLLRSASPLVHRRWYEASLLLEKLGQRLVLWLVLYNIY